MTNLTHSSFFVYVYSNSLHVSSIQVLIIRRFNCINTISGICHSNRLVCRFGRSNSNQLNMFRAMITPIFRSARLCVAACGKMHPRCCRPTYVTLNVWYADLNVLISISACFGRWSRPSSGAQDCVLQLVVRTYNALNIDTHIYWYRRYTYILVQKIHIYTGTEDTHRYWYRRYTYILVQKIHIYILVQKIHIDTGTEDTHRYWYRRYT